MTRISRVAFFFALLALAGHFSLAGQPVQTAGALPGAPGTTRATVRFSDLPESSSSEPGSPVQVPWIPGRPSREVPPGITLPPPGAEEPQPPQPLAPSPAPSSSFLALEDNNTFIPPDTHGAAGPNHLMTTLNSQIRVQNKSGGILQTKTLNTFWAGVNGGSGAFDPRVLYDPYGGRWITVAADDSASGSSGILVGVSQTSDPTGAWSLFKIDVDGTNKNWADFPTVGFNKDWVVVSVNMFSILGNFFQRSNVYVFTKSQLYAGGLSFRLFQNNGFAIQPAETLDAAQSALYMAEAWSGPAALLRLSRVTGPVGAESLQTGYAYVSVGLTWAELPSSGNADFAPQQGSTRRIMCNDDRLGNLVYRNGTLWTAHTVFLPPATGSRASVQWIQFSPSGILSQKGRLDDAAGLVYYAFPSIAVNANNDALLGYSRFSASQYASGNYAFRLGTDPLNTFRDDTVLKAGEAPYNKDFGAGRNRWGDYSHSSVDPVNDIDLWTIQEYAATPSGGFDRWGTWWGRITPPGSGVCTACPGADVGPLIPTTSWQTTTGTLQSGDCRKFLFQTVAGHTYRYSFCEGGGTAAFDTVLSAFGLSCSVTASNNDFCSTLSQFDVLATGIDQLIEVRGNGAADFGDFTLAYRDITAPCRTCPDFDFGPFNPSTTWQTHSSSIETDGCKIYKFNVLAGHDYRFSFCDDLGTASFDTVLDQLSSGCAVQQSMDDQCNALSAVDYTATANGVIYIRVRGYDSSQSGGYTLAYRDVTPPPVCLQCPDFDFGPFVPTTTYQTHSSTIAAGCWKNYQFSLTGGKTYRFTFCEGGGTATFDTILDRFGTLCALADTKDNQCGERSQLDYTPAGNESVLIRVSGAPGTLGDPNEGPYTLAFRELGGTTPPPPPGGGGSCVQCPSFDFGTFTPTSAWQTHASSIASGGCRTYRFNVVAGGLYRFTFCEGGGSAAWDTILEARLQNSCSLLNLNNNFCGLASQMDYISSYTGQLYVRVYGAATAAGSYTLAYRKTN